MSKYEKTCDEIARIEEKISQLSSELKVKKAKKAELENIEIIGAVREAFVDSSELIAFLESIKKDKNTEKKEVKADE